MKRIAIRHPPFAIRHPTMSIPQATFLNFLSGLGTQGLMQVGAIPHPITGERTANPDFARYTVELLGVLKDKSEGRRTPEEEQYLVAMIADLERRLAEITTAG